MCCRTVLTSSRTGTRFCDKRRKCRRKQNFGAVNSSGGEVHVTTWSDAALVLQMTTALKVNFDSIDSVAPTEVRKDFRQCSLF